MLKPLPVILAIFLLAAPAVAMNMEIIATGSSRVGKLIRTESTVQVGADPLDRFKIVHLVRDPGGGADVFSVLPHADHILLLPPAGFTFTFYEQQDPTGAIGTSIAEFFALRGYEVWGYSPRFDGIPAGACEAGVLDCSAMAGWGLASMVDDANFIRGQIEAARPGAEVFVGGFSLGAILAIAVVNDYPGDYAGLIAWDGFLYSEDAGVLAYAEEQCAELELALGAGVLFDGVTLNFLQQLGKVASQAPAAPTPIRLMPEFFTNHQALVAATCIPTPGPLTMPVPGYILANGSMTEGQLFFASEPRIFDSTDRLYDYLPLKVLRDLHCSVAGLDDTWVDGLDAFTGPVLAIGAGHGWGAYIEDQLGILGSTDVEFLFQPDFGHVDHFWSERHRDYLELPILQWLRRVGRLRPACR